MIFAPHTDDSRCRQRKVTGRSRGSGSIKGAEMHDNTQKMTPACTDVRHHE